MQLLDTEGQDEFSLLKIEGDILAHLIDDQSASRFQEPSQTMEDGNEDVDNETYLIEMNIDRNWQIPREKLELTGEKLGTGEFGIVQKGFYLRQDDSKLPVAVKTPRGLCFIS